MAHLCACVRACVRRRSEFVQYSTLACAAGPTQPCSRSRCIGLDAAQCVPKLHHGGRTSLTAFRSEIKRKKPLHGATW